MSANIISIATAELKKTTKICEKETADLVASEKELVSTVDTVARAIKIMEEEMNKNPVSFARVASKGFENVVSFLKDGVVEQAAHEEHFAEGDDVNKRITDSPSRLPPFRKRMGGRMWRDECQHECQHHLDCHRGVGESDKDLRKGNCGFRCIRRGACSDS